MRKRSVVIMGAAGRDFHNFLTYFKNNNAEEVICFTAEQIPGISERSFPKALAGKYYTKDIPIYKERYLTKIIKEKNIDEVVFAYSDVSHQEVMSKASIVLAAGASFRLLGPNDTMIKSKKPVIAITAVRTGAGKSQTSRAVAEAVRSLGKKIVMIRHPMPYGDLIKQKCQRFATLKDMEKHKTTIEEREEYVPWIQKGIIIYAGVDYKEILKQAEKEADIIGWDGGNNDFSFYVPDINIVVVDPHRVGHETAYHPGETNLRMADIIVVNKIDSAAKKDVEQLIRNCKKINKKASVIKARSNVFVEDANLVKGKRVLVIEDGPTMTHGGMKMGAGMIAAKKYKAKEIVNAKRYAVGSIKEVYREFPHLDKVLPAMGYGKKQVKELERTINVTKCDLVLNGSPGNLSQILKVNKPIVNVRYELKEIGSQTLKNILKQKRRVWLK